VDAVTTSGQAEEYLLGFDAREMLPAPQSWAAERRTVYLLRPEVRKPLSADSGVWLSLYADDSSDLGRPRMPALLRPQWTGPNAGLWDDLGRLEQNLATTHVAIPYWLVAVTWFADPASLSEPRNYGPYLEPMTPRVRSPDWPLLGFDVCDAGLLSGLMNCGYGDDARPALTVEWGPWLNEHHLFKDAESALAFRLMANHRVREHAPFFVYGLWFISEVAPRSATPSQ
jgi:hypothetical protein